MELLFHADENIVAYIMKQRQDAGPNLSGCGLFLTDSDHQARDELYK